MNNDFLGFMATSYENAMRDGGKDDVDIIMDYLDSYGYEVTPETIALACDECGIYLDEYEVEDLVDDYR